MSIQSRVANRTFFDDWKVQNYLGSGSGGRTAVFRMERNRGFTEVCALKVVNIIEENGKLESASPEYQRQFERRMQTLRDNALREVQLMYKLRGNPMVVNYLDFKTVRFQDAYSFGCDLLIRMELLRDVHAMQKSSYAFTEQEIIRVGKDVCRALQTCHAAGIVHRDIKPANLFRNEEGIYKLGDFGISRIVESSIGASTTIGTEPYAAPEQFLSGYDLRVDIYSLGLTLYELANNNCLPFSSSPFTDNIAIQRRLSGEPLPAPKNASPALRAVILKACAYKRENRYRTAAEFLHALEQAERQPNKAYWSAVGTPPGGSEPGKVNLKKDTGTAGQKPPSGSIWETQPAQPSQTGSFWQQATEQAMKREPPKSEPPKPEPPKPEPPKPEPPKRRHTIGPLGGILLIGLICFLVFRFYHTWTPATCTEPETCSLCGETRGVANGHTWTAATCTKPKTCSVCGETSGTAQHTWVEATHELPETCSVCGKTSGDPKGYISRMGGDWAEDSITLNYCEGHPLLLDETVTQCFRFTLYFEISDVTGNPFGTFAVYGKNDAGEWIQLGTFQMEMLGNTEAQIDLAEPASFSAIYVIPLSEEECTWKDVYYLKEIYTNNE